MSSNLRLYPGHFEYFVIRYWGHVKNFGKLLICFYSFLCFIRQLVCLVLSHKFVPFSMGGGINVSSVPQIFAFLFGSSLQMQHLGITLVLE